MIKVNEEKAYKEAAEIAKILCANPNCTFQVNKGGANQIADFIETLQNRFMGQDNNAY